MAVGNVCSPRWLTRRPGGTGEVVDCLAGWSLDSPSSAQQWFDEFQCHFKELSKIIQFISNASVCPAMRLTLLVQEHCSKAFMLKRNNIPAVELLQYDN